MIRFIYAFLIMICVYLLGCKSLKANCQYVRNSFRNAVQEQESLQIQALGKRCDLAEADDGAFIYRNHILLITMANLCAAIFPILILLKRQRRAKMETILVEHENKQLHQQKKDIERKLLDIEFILSLYQQISQQNVTVKALLSDLKTNAHVVKNPQLAGKISEAYIDFVANAAIHFEKVMTDNRFEEFTGIRLADPQILSSNEKMLLALSNMNLDNQQLSILFNTTESSIRGRKAKLRAKIQVLGIDINGITI